MALKLIKKIPIKGNIKKPLIVGMSYYPDDEICFSELGVVTVADLCLEYPDAFSFRDTQEILEKVVISISQNYAYLHKYYGEPTEEFMAEKIKEISEKIISKL